MKWAAPKILLHRDYFHYSGANLRVTFHGRKCRQCEYEHAKKQRLNRTDEQKEANRTYQRLWARRKYAQVQAAFMGEGVNDA